MSHIPNVVMGRCAIPFDDLPDLSHRRVALGGGHDKRVEGAATHPGSYAVHGPLHALGTLPLCGDPTKVTMATHNEAMATTGRRQNQSKN